MKTRLKKWSLYLPFLIILILLIFIYTLDFPQGDDFLFTVTGGSWKKIWDCYVAYYFENGSRMANMLAQIFLLSGLRIWGVLTPFVITGISLLLYYYAAGRLTAEKEAPCRHETALACICASFPGIIPVAHHMFADTFMWMDGSCNYLYPVFLMLAGFIPFYNTIRNRTIPRAARWICPACLVLSALLHEQIAILLAVMCIICLLYLYKDKRVTGYLLILGIFTAAILVFTLTAPGAYARLSRTGGDTGRSLPRKLITNFFAYLYPLTTAYWPWIAIMGICALFLLHRKKSKIFTVLSFYICFGIVLSAFTIISAAPSMQEQPFYHSSHLRDIFELLLGTYWTAYFAVILIAFILSARINKKYRFLVILYMGMWASQGIPAMLGCSGRPMFHLIIMTFLMALCLLQEVDTCTADILKYAVSAFAICVLLNSVPYLQNNKTSYQYITQQVAAAKAGQRDTVVINNSKFNWDYAYYNSFHPRYKDNLRVYFKLPKNADLQIK